MKRSLVSILTKANQQLYNESINPLRSHGVDHHQRVYEYALKLAEITKSVYDFEILTAACLLHDLAAYCPDKIGDKYHDYDKKLANEILIKVKFNPAKIEQALEAISNHGSDPKYKTSNESIETKLLRDADKLDVFGPLGVARIIMVRTLKGDSLNDIVDDFLTRGHLQRKWNSISFKEAKVLCHQDYEYSLNFFKELANKLNKTSPKAKVKNVAK